MCHSTGGIIVKRVGYVFSSVCEVCAETCPQAITKRVMEGVADIGAECLGVAFFGECSDIATETIY